MSFIIMSLSSAEMCYIQESRKKQTNKFLGEKKLDLSPQTWEKSGDNLVLKNSPWNSLDLSAFTPWAHI